MFHCMHGVARHCNCVLLRVRFHGRGVPDGSCGREGPGVFPSCGHGRPRRENARACCWGVGRGMQGGVWLWLWLCAACISQFVGHVKHTRARTCAGLVVFGEQAAGPSVRYARASAGWDAVRCRGSPSAAGCRGSRAHARDDARVRHPSDRRDAARCERPHARPGGRPVPVRGRDSLRCAARSGRRVGRLHCARGDAAASVVALLYISFFSCGDF